MKPGKEHPAWLHRAMGGRCDRPARAEGGRAPQWTGEGDSGKQLREDANDLDTEAKGKMTKGFGKAAVGAAGTGLFRLGRTASGMADRAAKVGSIGMLGSGAKDIVDSLNDSTTARRKYEAADKAEGRAKGGTVKKRSKR